MRGQQQLQYPHSFRYPKRSVILNGVRPQANEVKDLRLSLPSPNRGQLVRNAQSKRRIALSRVDAVNTGHAQMSGSVPSDRSSNPVRRLVFLAALMIVMYVCMCTLCFTHAGLNIAFVCLFHLLPLFAIKPALRLPLPGKIVTLSLLFPLLAFSLLGLSGAALFDIPDAVNHRLLSRELCTLNQGQYSVHLLWEETSGGAVGPHRVSLEQRRTILPGIYAVKYLDYFEGASEGSISFVGPDRVSLQIPIAGYDRDQKKCSARVFVEALALLLSNGTMVAAFAFREEFTYSEIRKTTAVVDGAVRHPKNMKMRLGKHPSGAKARCFLGFFRHD